MEYAAASTPAHQPSRIRSRQPAGSPIRYPTRRDFVSGPIASVMAAATTIKESADDILAEAKDINEKRAAEAEAQVIEDSAEKAE